MAPWNRRFLWKPPFLGSMLNLGSVAVLKGVCGLGMLTERWIYSITSPFRDSSQVPWGSSKRINGFSDMCCTPENVMQPLWAVKKRWEPGGLAMHVWICRRDWTCCYYASLFNIIQKYLYRQYLCFSGRDDEITTNFSGYDSKFFRSPLGAIDTLLLTHSYPCKCPPNGPIQPDLIISKIPLDTSFLWVTK